LLPTQITTKIHQSAAAGLRGEVSRGEKREELTELTLLTDGSRARGIKGTGVTRRK